MSRTDQPSYCSAALRQNLYFDPLAISNGGRFVRVRGAIKVKSHLMFGMLALTVD